MKRIQFLNQITKLTVFVTFGIFTLMFFQSDAYGDTTIEDITVTLNTVTWDVPGPLSLSQFGLEDDGITIKFNDSSESRKYNFFRSSSSVSYDISFTAISSTKADFTIDTVGFTDIRLEVSGSQLTAVELDGVPSSNWSFNGIVNTINIDSAQTVSLFFSATAPPSTSGGGGGGDSSKPIIADILLNGNLDLLNSKHTLKVGQPITITINVNENQGTNNLEHVSLYFDTKKPDQSQDFKTTHIRWEKQYSPIINNPNNILDFAKITVTPTDAVNTEVEIEFSFATSIDSVHLQLAMWDLDKNQIQEYFPNVFQVLPDESNSKPLTEFPENESEIIDELEIDSEPIFSWELFNEWAGYSSQSISDKDFLSHLGIDGEKIPDWMKGHNAKWLKNNLITQQDLLNAIKNLEQRDII